MRILGQMLFPWQCVILLLISLQYRMCAVTLTADPLICGEPGIIRCLVQPFEVVSWERNGIAINDCITSGICLSPDSGGLFFTVNVTEKTYVITLNPLDFGTYNGDKFTCIDSNGPESITLNISVPFTGISLAESQSGGDHVLTASSSCVKSSITIPYTWSCVSPSDNATVIHEHCNVTSVTSSVDSSSCTSGSDCSGSGLEVKNEILTLTSYVGTDSQLVRISVTSDGFTEVSSNTYQIQKTVTSEGDSKKCPFISCILPIIVVIVVILVVSGLIIYSYRKKKLCWKKDNEKPDPIPPVSAADLQTPVLSGWFGLYEFKKLQPRWCVLQRGVLYFFTKPEDTKQCGAFIVAGYKFREATFETNKMEDQKLAFELYSENKNDSSIYQFVADDRKDYERWKKYFDGTSSDVTNPTAEDPNKMEEDSDSESNATSKTSFIKGHNGNKVQPATKGADGHNENIALQETPRVKAQQLPPIDPNHKAPDNISNVSVTQVSPHMEGNPQTNDEATNLRKKRRGNKDNTRGLSANVDTNNVWENEPPFDRKLPKVPMDSQQIMEENKTSEIRITASEGY